MTPNQIAAQFSTKVGEVASATLSQITGKTWTCEVSADNIAPAEIAVRFHSALGLSGEFSFNVTKRAAIELARIFVGDVPPSPELVEPAEEDCEALDELMRTIGGSAATALRTYFGKLELKFMGREAAEWTPAQCWSLTLTQDNTSIRIVLALSGEILTVKEEPAVVAEVVAAPEPQPTIAPTQPVAPPAKSASVAAPTAASPAVRPPATPVSAGSTAIPVNRHDGAVSGSKMQELMRDGNLDLLLDVELAVTLRFGRREMLIKDILELSSGSVIELDRQVSEPVDLLIDRKIIARGEVVIVDGNYGLRVTHVATPEQKIECLR
jgi:flagellar motor switch protein FliN/FliY